MYIGPFQEHIYKQSTKPTEIYHNSRKQQQKIIEIKYLKKKTAKSMKTKYICLIDL